MFTYPQKKDNAIDFVLIEITLNQYGYVVPMKGTFNSKLPTLNYKPVARFTKKLTALVVEELLKKGEFRDGGVLAFCLCLHDNCCSQYMQSDIFEGTR